MGCYFTPRDKYRDISCPAYMLVVLSDLLSATHIVECLQRKFLGRQSRLPTWAVTAWVLVSSLAVLLFFVLGASSGAVMLTALVVGAYRLFENMLVWSRTIFAERYRREGNMGKREREIPVRSGGRWIFLALWNLLEACLYFSVAYYFWSGSFQTIGGTPIASKMTAFYYSMLTITTLGYGEFTPVNDWGRAIVCLELIYFLVFLVTTIPIALSLVKAFELKADQQ